MGIDITVHLERRNKDTGNWESLRLYTKESDGKFKPCSIYNYRNSELFALLADVGASFVFPVINTGCLTTPRGLPDDISPEVKEAYGDGEWYFNATWYDFCELEAYEHMLKDATKELKRKDDKIKGLEKQIKRMTSFLPHDDEGNLIDDDDGYLDEDEYPVSYCLTGFVESIRAVLEAYKIFYPSPNEVRVIMWFDN